MNGIIHIKEASFEVDFSTPISISLPISNSINQATAWGASPVSIDPVVQGDFIGDITQGGAVNFKKLTISPHGNGTHTECVGHIIKGDYTLNRCIRQYAFMANLISVCPVQKGSDLVITKELLVASCAAVTIYDALIIRTLPNTVDKQNKAYLNTNPPYFTAEAMQWLVDQGVEHLLVDLPSVDKEQDEGKLLAHKAFWNTSSDIQYHKTITELVFVPDTVMDGIYFLQLSVLQIDSDASPSNPILYSALKLNNR